MSLFLEKIQIKMKVKLLYGKNGLPVSLPDKTQIIEPIFIDKLKNELDSIKKSIMNPYLE